MIEEANRRAPLHQWGYGSALPSLIDSTIIIESQVA
jgi:hypothetical protein